VIRFWSRMLLGIVGVRVLVRGEPIDPRLAGGIVPGSAGRMLLSNHVSWLDIYAINAAVPSRFVAKAEIAAWPLAGWLAARAGTLFVERGRRHAVHAINQAVASRLAAGETIGVFPEGTTTDGRELLPFHANLVQPALDAGAEIRPVAVRYVQDGAWAPAAAYIGDMTLLGSLWQVVTTARLVVHVHWLPQLSRELDNRHAVCRAARAAIGGALGVALEGEPAAVASLGVAIVGEPAAVAAQPAGVMDPGDGTADTPPGGSPATAS
jgi:1-acyl-sn-glycerol-3-phosphate acyltransferase